MMLARRCLSNTMADKRPDVHEKLGLKRGDFDDV